MEILFLGTGSAWAAPEYSCACAICRAMETAGEERTRSCFVVEAEERILVDCGPDIRIQMNRVRIGLPDAVLITHEHGDHFLGLDDLLAFKRALPREAWKPIPTFASEKAWDAIETRFGYLLGSLLEKRVAAPGRPLEGLKTVVTPFKTNHGPTAPGSIGYSFSSTEGGEPATLVYTSDFVNLEDPAGLVEHPDVLVIQAHWFNEPLENKPYHMSFQRAMDFIREHPPRSRAYLTHISAGDQVPGDPWNNAMKKFTPLKPLAPPNNAEPYPIPRRQDEWQSAVERAARDHDLPVEIIVAHDGLIAGI
jgi:phosphoribosyl 1,2-cyclic phosphate phosphodiesterase